MTTAGIVAHLIFVGLASALGFIAGTAFCVWFEDRGMK